MIRTLFTHASRPLLALAIGLVAGLTPVDQFVAPTDAQAIIGRPFTPLSFAGVARRSFRRHVWWGAGAAAGAAAVGAAAVGAGAAAASYNAAAYNSAYNSAYQGAYDGAAAGSDAAAPPAPAPAPDGLTVGTVVAHLPSGCKQVVSNNVIYEHCGGVYYQPKFMGSSTVYVVSRGP